MKFLCRFFFAVLVCCLPACAQLPKPDMVLEGAVTVAQNHTHFMVPFTVPAGVHRITVDFSYDHRREEKTVFNIGIHDPVGFRGQSGSNKDHFTIGPADATPSYIPGAIPPGQWNLLISVSNIRPEITSKYRAEIRFNSPLEDSSFTLEPLSKEQRWYRGDLHMHTGHSDGFCASQNGQHVPCPLFLTAQAATNRGLDFIAISDHNSMAHYAEMRAIQPYFDEMLLIPGREMTTFYGHFNMFGVTQYVDYRVAEKGGRTIDEVVHDARALGGIVSINHPESPTGERCRGCGWTPPGYADLSKFSAVEVVNSGHLMDKFWDQQLAKGLRLTAIGGSDNHDSSKAENVIGAIAHPTTVVQASELSVAGVLDGIRAGHVFIDLTASKGTLLDVDANSSQGTAHMGDVLRAKRGEDVRMHVHVSGCAHSQVQTIVDGKPVDATLSVDADDQTVETHWTSDGAKHWIRFIVRDVAGKPLLVGNPVYVNE
jgi:predicted metal-dependent phosphoesterase TrpH